MTDMSQLLPGAAPLQPEDAALRPAKINDRVIAYLLDTLPFTVGYYACLNSARLPQLLGDANLSRKLAAAWIAVYWLYQTAGNLSGGTIGKRLMGIAAVTLEGEALGAGRSALRALGNVISTPLCNLGYIIALFHPESRALHDFLAGTVVVERRLKGPVQSWLLFFAAMASISGMFAGSFFLAARAPTRGDVRRLAKAREGLPILAKIQDAYFAAHGTYAGSLAELAQASGDPAEFHSAMEDLFDLHRMEIKAGNKRYRITTAALDRRRTPVTIEGP